MVFCAQALRAGTVDRDNPYRFALPSSWRENQVPLLLRYAIAVPEPLRPGCGSWASRQLGTRDKQVANIQSGNYCQPRCAEPWTEVIFTDPAEGKVQVPPLPSAQLSVCVPGNSNSLKRLLRAEAWREAPVSMEAITSASPVCR